MRILNMPGRQIMPNSDRFGSAFAWCDTDDSFGLCGLDYAELGIAAQVNSFIGYVLEMDAEKVEEIFDRNCEGK